MRKSLIRELVLQIEQLAREHPCYSQVYDIIQVACDHMQARARIEELHQQEAERDRGTCTGGS